MTVIGIDPGASGAFAVLSKSQPPLIVRMPKKIEEIADIVRSICSEHVDARWAMEQLPACVGDGTAITGAQMGVLHRNAGRVEGLVYGFTGTAPRMYAPQSWQAPLRSELPHKKQLPEKNRQTLWKNALRECAACRFPSFKVPLYAADALLIAHHHQNQP